MLIVELILLLFDSIIYREVKLVGIIERCKEAKELALWI
jgi:hypothetical protein